MRASGRRPKGVSRAGTGGAAARGNSRKAPRRPTSGPARRPAKSGVQPPPDAAPRPESARNLVEPAGEEYARRFLAGVLLGDAALAEQFAKGMGSPLPAGLDYGKRVDEAFREAVADVSMERERVAYVDLEGVMKSAGEFERSGDLVEASRIYGQIAGAIVGNEDLSYLKGNHLEAGPVAVGKWAECLDWSSPEPAKRRAAISRAFGMFKRGGVLCDAYGHAMMALCDTDADLRHLLGLARPHAQPPPAPRSAGKRGRAKAGPASLLFESLVGRIGGLESGGPREEGEGVGIGRMVSAVVEILDRLGRATDANRLIAGHARLHPGACALLVKRLAGAGSKQEAAGAAAAGLDRFGNDPEIAEAAMSIYGRGGSSRARCAILTDLFMRTADESYYERLRGMPGWKRERPSFIRAVSGNARFRRFFLVDILVREGMHKRAIGEIAASGQVDLFEAYRAKLSAAEPRAYLAAYGRYVKTLGERAATAKQYASVSKHLKNISRVRDGGRDAAASIAVALTRKYPGKRKLAAALAPFLR